MTPESLTKWISNNQHRFPKNLRDRTKELINDGKIKIGEYVGPMHSQKYSRSRVAGRLRKWDSQRFDQHLLKEDYGILKNEYYTKGLLRLGKVDIKFWMDGPHVALVVTWFWRALGNPVFFRFIMRGSI